MRATSFLIAAFLVLAGPAATACTAAETKQSARGMTYSIRVPDGYDRAKGALLVVGFHGWGGEHTQLMRGMEAFGFLRDAILVAPNAPKAAAWEEADLDPTADLLDELKRGFNVQRTIAFGFSRGAYFSFGLGLRFPDKVEALVPHSGGMILPVPPGEAAKKQTFYVIHGDADNVVPVAQSRDAVSRLKGAGLTRVEYEEIKGLAHRIDPAAVERAFAWIEKTLGPAAPALTDAQADERIDAIEKAIKDKDLDAAAQGFGTLAGAPRKFHARIASLAKAHVKSTHEPLALAAIEAAGALGPVGVAPLKTVPATSEAPAIAAAAALARTGSPDAVAPLLAYLKAKPEPVAVAAAQALGDLGGDAATAALVKGLEAAEGSPSKAERRDAILEALKRLTGQSFATAREWKRWLAQKV